MSNKRRVRDRLVRSVPLPSGAHPDWAAQVRGAQVLLPGQRRFYLRCELCNRELNGGTPVVGPYLDFYTRCAPDCVRYDTRPGKFSTIQIPYSFIGPTPLGYPHQPYTQRGPYAPVLEIPDGPPPPAEPPPNLPEMS